MSHVSTRAVSNVAAGTKNDEAVKENLLANACVNIAIVLCTFGIWSVYSPMTVVNRGITVTHIRHLAQRGSGTAAVPLPSFNVTRLGLDETDSVLVLFPRSWQTARWSRVVVRFDRYPYDKLTGIDIHLREDKNLRTLTWVGDRLILDATLNNTMRFQQLDAHCEGARTTLGVAFLKMEDGIRQWDEAVVVRASKLVKAFPLVKIDDALWLAGQPSAVDRWWGRVQHTGDIPGNVSLFGPSPKWHTNSLL